MLLVLPMLRICFDDAVQDVVAMMQCCMVLCFCVACTLQALQVS